MLKVKWKDLKCNRNLFLVSFLQLIRQYQGYVPVPIVYDTDEDVKDEPHDDSEVEELLDDQDNQVNDLYKHLLVKIRQLSIFP